MGATRSYVVGHKKFRKRVDWIFCRPTRVSQSVRAEFTQSTMTIMQMNSILHTMFVNMDQTAVYFNEDYNYTVNKKGANTVSA